MTSRRSPLSVWIVLIAAAALLLPRLAQAADRPAGWKAGIARVKITPAEPIWMAGYAGRQHPAEGKLHDLWVKVLALEDAGGRKAVVVASDLLGFPQAIAKTICEQVKSRYGLGRDQVMLTCSHTHSGPVLQNALVDIYPVDAAGQAKIAAYSRQLEQWVVKAVGEAGARMEPVELSTGEGRATFAANRRNNPEREVPKLREAGKPLKGPMDHRVPVLAVRGLDGRLRAVLLLYACHNTVLDGYQWSGDYAGEAQLALEKKHPGATALFTIGCGADQNPIPRRSVELSRKYGEVLGDAVDQVLAGSMQPVEPALATTFQTIRLPFAGQLDRKALEVEAKKANYQGRWAGRILKIAADAEARGEPLPADYPYPIQVWRIGRHNWIALGGEVVVDYALSFEKQFGPNAWVIGYANDVMSYIPSRRVWAEGGYEAGAFPVYGLPAQRWSEQIESRITDATAKLIQQAKK